MANQKGRLIVFYGTNNLGKSTQAKLLVENLIIRVGKEAEYLKYAIYTLEPSGSLINSYLREKNPYTFSPREFQILQVLNRTQYEPKLLEKLNKGKWIVAEDYVGTGIAWGLATGIDKKLLYNLNSHLIKEDLGILFQGEPFPENLEKDNVHETDIALLGKVNTAFKEIARDFNWHIINANQPIETVTQEIADIIKSKLVYLE
jgi:thymidylate kinase